MRDFTKIGLSHTDLLPDTILIVFLFVPFELLDGIFNLLDKLISGELQTV